MVDIVCYGLRNYYTTNASCRRSLCRNHNPIFEMDLNYTSSCITLCPLRVWSEYSSAEEESYHIIQVPRITVALWLSRFGLLHAPHTHTHIHWIDCVRILWIGRHILIGRRYDRARAGIRFHSSAADCKWAKLISETRSRVRRARCVRLLWR